MIFVLLGTQDAPFSRLIELIYDLVQTPGFDEDVIVQAGTTPVLWKSRHVTVQPLFNKTEFQTHLKEARLVITHGGAGTIFEALSERKKTIVVPRQAKHREHVDDHQFELTEMLADLQCIEMYHSGDLIDIIRRVEQNEYTTYEPDHTLIHYIQRRLT